MVYMCGILIKNELTTNTYSYLSLRDTSQKVSTFIVTPSSFFLISQYINPASIIVSVDPGSCLFRKKCLFNPHLHNKQEIQHVMLTKTIFFKQIFKTLESLAGIRDWLFLIHFLCRCFITHDTPKRKQYYISWYAILSVKQSTTCEHYDTDI